MSDASRGIDPHDKRGYVPPYEPEKPRDPLNDPIEHPGAYVPNSRAGDPRDKRDTRSQGFDAFDDAFTFPQYALAGQSVTSTFGKVYQFDGQNWKEGASALASTYTFRIGIDETSPGIVDVMPARALPGEIGGINEPQADGVYLRNATGGVYSWVPSAAGSVYIWDIGLTEAPVGTISLDPATATTIGGITEPPTDGLWSRRALGTVYSWEVSTAAAALTFDTGLTLTGTSVNLDPALPPGGEIGGINEPPPDTGAQYTRSYTGGVGLWTEMSPASLTAGIGLDFVPPGGINIDLLPPAAGVIGGVWVPARAIDQGLLLDPLGTLTAPLATALLAGSIVEPAADGDYIRRAAAGVFTWEVATQATLIWGIGIDEDTTTPGTIHVQPANFTPGEIGGVTSEPRSLTQGLLLDDVTGHLTLPPATDLLLGGIEEPTPSDTILYARKRTVAGVSTWEPVQAGAFVGDAPPPAPNTQGQFWFESDTGKLFVYFDDGNSQQWVQVGGV